MSRFISGGPELDHAGVWIRAERILLEELEVVIADQDKSKETQTDPEELTRVRQLDSGKSC
jgi:hypothetical protein